MMHLQPPRRGWMMASHLDEMCWSIYLLARNYSQLVMSRRPRLLFARTGEVLILV